MLLRLILLMTVVPALELYLLIQLGQWMGALQTVLLIMVTGSVGAVLAKREGLGVLAQLKAEAAKGIPPADRLVEGLLVIVGGVLLITPGVLTDLFGFLLILQPSRRFLAPRLKGWVAQRVVLFPGPGLGPKDVWPEPASAESAPPPGRSHARFDHPIQGG